MEESQVTAEEFLATMSGATIENVRTDGIDLYMEMQDGRVFLFTCYNNMIVLGQARARPTVLQ